MKQLGIGLVGCGTVGGGVWRNLAAKRELIASRTGIEFEIRRVAALDFTRCGDVPQDRLTKDWHQVVHDPKVDIVVELMGGTGTALEVIRTALEAGKPVVTANKALLAKHGQVLGTLADAKGLPFYFEASVAGGIPILKALREGFRANTIRSIHGIINGTCNYILTQMSEKKEAFATVLAEAKRLGYAEADESLDVDGIDSAHKVAVLASLAYGFWITSDQVYVEGIRGVTDLDTRMAAKLGYTIKLLGIIRQHSCTGVEVRVHPTLIPSSHVLASVGGVFNAVAVEGDVVGQTLFYGRGAGADATSSAVLSDICEAGMDLIGKRNPMSASGHNLYGKLLTMDEVVTRRYVRLTVLDKPGVLGQIASIFGSHNIGISSVFQPEEHEGDTLPLIMLLDPAKESVFNTAAAQVSSLEVVKAAPTVLRMEDFS